MQNISGFLVFILGVSLLFSCKKTEKIPFKEISLERWTVSGNADSYEKGAIQYLEKTLYNDQGKEEAKLFYNIDKELIGQEIRVFDSNNILKGSQYKDPQDNLLSYYTFKLNDDQTIAESNAYDANSSELMRTEKYTYNKNGYLIEKLVLDANQLPSRKFVYTLDEHGNELQVQVLQPDGTEILTEVFQITKYNNKNHWIEKWGFSKDKPFSYLARTISYAE